MRFLGFTITRDPKPIPAPPTRFCTCDSMQHLNRVAALARDLVLALFLWENYQRMLGH